MNGNKSYLSELEVLKSILRETDIDEPYSTLILGFFGSGKTTFANQFINSKPDLNFAAMVEDTQPGKVSYTSSKNLKIFVPAYGIFSLIHYEVRVILENTDIGEIDHLLVELADFSNPVPKAME